VSAREYLQAFWPAVSASAAMALAVTALRATVLWGEPLIVRFALQVVVGACVYVSVIMIWHRARIDVLLQFRNALRPARSTGRINGAGGSREDSHAQF
jgi:hypothetical protein